jgi:hypothetical protein
MCKSHENTDWNEIYVDGSVVSSYTGVSKEDAWDIIMRSFGMGFPVASKVHSQMFLY